MIYIGKNIFVLFMENHCYDVIRRMETISTKITALINKYT